MRMLSVILSFLSLVGAGNASAQQQYPQGYFINPLKIPMLLAGNFGECRPGHFHSGLDIKTEGRENLPVYAAAAGYIARIKMEPGGFGHALYIRHPNGYTTLYAHLNNFSQELQSLVHREQYARKNWELDLELAPEQFPVKQGQFIARSGNTGGSTAPHLHFEIRDTKTEHPLNPQLFGFEIEDRREAVPTELVFYDAGKSIYEQTPQRIKLGKSGNLYTETTVVRIPQNKTLVGIAVNDYMNGSENTLSVYRMEWYWNDSLAGTLTLDDIGYEETRYLNACADYALHAQTGVWYNSLFVLKGNQLGRLYQIPIKELSLRDSNRLRIVIMDNSGNQSIVQSNVFKAPVADTGIAGKCADLWEAMAAKRFELPGVVASFTAGTTYDDVCFRYERQTLPDAASALHRLHDPKVPLHKAFSLSMQPDRAIPFRLQSKICMRYADGKDSSGKAAAFTDQRYQASFRNLGSFWLEVDTTAPAIRLLQRGKRQLRVQVTDRQSGVAAVNGYIRSSRQWLCFERHGKEWFYSFDEYLPAKGTTLIEIEVIDENGNRSKKEIALRR